MNELDPRTVLQALGVADASAVAPIGGGWDTALWRVERPSGSYALRVFPPGREVGARREAAVMRAARDAGVPVPGVRAEGVRNGRAALLLDWCPGRTLLDAARARPWSLLALGVAFGRAQARINAQPAPAVLQAEGRDWIAWAGPEEAALDERLRALAPVADRLLHLDYHPLNVMVSGDSVSGVLDWANARSGDPRADVARTTTILRLAGAGPPGPARPALALALRLFEWAWRRGYWQVAGPLADLAPFYAWAGAVMLRDLAPKVGRQDVWLGNEELARIARWTRHWKERAGIRE